ncbi:Hypothetical protein PHPALM_37653 [Phytophthora palmivora]|uniref:Uncharacterized protein n=1 Tax=Phytophthora palmivora TaxID=4796 RepID=A0A2P4WWX8_9STRA|nr:Hypothetical protein PHPALM_37653 [Phytophthora palmivora]
MRWRLVGIPKAENIALKMILKEVNGVPGGVKYAPPTRQDRVIREGRDKTCFQIWHENLKNGNDIPSSVLQGHKLRDRPPAQRSNKRRRRLVSDNAARRSGSASGSGSE